MRGSWQRYRPQTKSGIVASAISVRTSCQSENPPCAVSTTSLAKYSAEKNSAEAPVTVASSWSLATLTTYKRTAPQTGLSALSLLAQSDTGLRLAGDCQGGGRRQTSAIVESARAVPAPAPTEEGVV